MKRKLFWCGIVATSGAWALASVALADSAPAKPTSDYQPNNVELNVTPGSIDQKPAQASVSGGAAMSSNGQAGASFTLDLEKPYYLGGSVKKDDGGETSNGILFAPGVHARVDVQGAANQNVDVTHADVRMNLGSLFHLQGAWHLAPKYTSDEPKLSQDDQERHVQVKKIVVSYQDLKDQKGEPWDTARMIFDSRERDAGYKADETPEINDLKGRISWLNSRKYEDFTSARLKGVTDPAKIEQIKAEAARIQALSDAQASAEVDRLEKQRDQLYAKAKQEFLEKADAKPAIVYETIHDASATADFDAMKLGARYIHDTRTGYDTAGGQIGILNTSWHGAFRINGENIDLCGAIQAPALILGQSTSKAYDGGKSYATLSAAAKLCAGFQVGQIGHVGDEVSVENLVGLDKSGDNGLPSGDVLRFANTASLDKIGNSPVGLFYTYEKDSTLSDAGLATSVDTHVAGVRASF